MKAGAMTGLVTGAVPIISLTLLESLIWYHVRTPLPLLAVAYLLPGLIVVAAVSTVVVTAVLSLVGVMYAAVEKWIPVNSIPLKSLILFLTLWIVTYFLIVPVRVPAFFPDTRFEILTLVWALLFAWLFAHFLAKYQKLPSADGK